MTTSKLPLAEQREIERIKESIQRGQPDTTTMAAVAAYFQKQPKRCRVKPQGIGWIITIA